MNRILDAQAKSLTHVLYFDILTGIVAGEYPSEASLPTETRLATDYGVSRSVVRSALELLKERGVVHSEQGSGTYVCDLEQEQLDSLLPEECPYEFLDCFSCRRAIEPEIAAQLAGDCPDVAIDYLGSELEQLESMDMSDWQRSRMETVQDTDFHIKLAELTGNSFFHSIMLRMRPHILIGMNNEKNLQGSARKNHIDRNITEHRQIIRAILGGNSDDARRAMNNHLQNGLQRIYSSGGKYLVKSENADLQQA